ncbi:MAG TPA: glycosyl hydrolase family 28 protein [Kiritimatiellia bacterium]|nr:glycosyl hydrolase family 28 protein [Kiritimatiellia bacterium]
MHCTGWRARIFHREQGIIMMAKFSKGVVLFAFALAQLHVVAVDVNWTGGADDGNKWSTGGNWQGGQTPTTDDVAVFNVASATTINVDTEDAIAKQVKIAAASAAVTFGGDGIDCCGVKDTVIRNSFIHTQDDCIAVKWSAENLTVSNCIFVTDEANIVRMGYECGVHAKFENVVFRDIDALHLAMAKRTAEKYWCNGCLLLQASHEAVMRDILFENIRLKDFEDGRDELFVAKTMSIKSIAGDNGPWTTPLAGHINGVTLRNITGPRQFTRADIKLIEKDQDHKIENVKFIQPPSVRETEVSSTVMRVPRRR